MGYTTEFWGSVMVEPPLNLAEVEFLTKFSDTRRMKRRMGPYFVDGSEYAGQGHDDDVQEYTSPPDGQPGLWCQWVPGDDGLVWNGTEKFYNSEEWMRYLIDHFLKPGCVVQQLVENRDSSVPLSILAQFERFTFDHIVNGVIDAQGEEASDRWRLIVTDNKVCAQSAKIVWE